MKFEARRMALEWHSPRRWNKEEENRKEEGLGEGGMVHVFIQLNPFTVT